jgi:hypothetical protein
VLYYTPPTSEHILVIINSYKNIVRDVIEPRRGKKARIVKAYELDYMVYTLEEYPLSLKEVISVLDDELWQGSNKR